MNRRLRGIFAMAGVATVFSGFLALWPWAIERASAADDAYRSKTLQLRTGPVTLEPTQAPPPKDAQPSERPKSAPGPTAPGKAGRRSTRSLESTPAPAGENKEAAEPRALNRAVTSERVILSFERRVTDSERASLARNGIEVGDFLGDTAYTARTRLGNAQDLVNASRGVNTVQHVIALDERAAHIKVDPALSALQARLEETRASQPQATPQTLIVQLWPDADLEAAKRRLEPLGQIVRLSPRTHKIELVVPNYDNLQAISKLEAVKYISPFYGIKSQNTHAAKNVGINIAAAAPHSLTGRNVKIGIWDGGHVAANHPSFANRLSVALEREHVARHDEDHATHVAGTIAGSGEFVLVQPAVAGEGSPTTVDERKLPPAGEELISKPKPLLARAPIAAPMAERPTDREVRYPGMAPAAQLLSFDFQGAADELIDLLLEKPDAIDVMNNSWGLNLQPWSCAQLGAYNVLDAREFDAVVSGQKNDQRIRRIPIIFAAGNTRNDGICGLSTAPGFANYRTVIAPGTAKNVITVGAIDADDNSMTEFSSWGPTLRGRLKPDIVAPGCRSLGDGERGIVSMFLPDGLGRMCGTSMATPVVTGVVALMIEKMERLGFAKSDVFPSTYKALLIHGAEDLGRPGPDFEFGYGRVHLPATLKLMDDKAFQQKQIDREGEAQTLDLTVPANTQELKVTLVWDDRPTGVFAEEALSNDLDLVLLSPTGIQHLPLLLNSVPGKETEPARPGVDHLNVVEQVVVKQPDPGIWRLQVRANKIGSPTGGQTYTLVSSAR